MWEFLSDSQLEGLDRYKDLDLIKAINECNLYTQANTKIIMTENIGEKDVNIIRGTGPLHMVMDYVNEEAISRDALIESMYKLNLYAAQRDSNELTKVESECVGFAINLLYDLLSKNTMFIPYKCVKTFRPRATTTGNDIDKNDSLSLTNKYISMSNENMNTLFDFNLGEWIYITDEEMKNLELVEFDRDKE